ncbi:CBS domain-containing protein [Streptomyces nigra]|uniref:CBS domain-containing protein n=1 Tax=Streptomyces nigra TaxID=1827580 RepID=UPI00363D2FCB
MNHQKVRDQMSDAVVRVQAATPFMEIAHLNMRGEPREGEDEADASAGRAKARATDAAGLMTSPALCAREDWSVVDAARMMARHRVKRLLVVDADGRLIGVVSRSDLLRVYLRTDQAIRREIVEEVLVKALGESPAEVQVDVTHGHVVLSGHLSSRTAVPVLKDMCRAVDGVVAVEYRPPRAAESDDPSGPPLHSI